MAASFRGALLRGVKITAVTGPTIPDAAPGSFQIYDLFNGSGSIQDVSVQNPTPVGLFWDIVSGSPTLSGSGTLSMATGSSVRTQCTNADNSGYNILEVNYAHSATDSALVVQSVIGTTTMTMTIYGTTHSGTQGKIEVVATDAGWNTTTYSAITTGTVNYAGSKVEMVMGQVLLGILVDGNPVVWVDISGESISPFGNVTYSLSVIDGTATYTVADAKQVCTFDAPNIGAAPFEFNEVFSGSAGPIGGKLIAGATASTYSSYWTPSADVCPQLNGSGGLVCDCSLTSSEWIQTLASNVTYTNGFSMGYKYNDVNSQAENVVILYIGNSVYQMTVTDTGISGTSPGTVILQVDNGVSNMVLYSYPNSTPTSVDRRGDDIRFEITQASVTVYVNNTPINMYVQATDTLFTGAIPFTIATSGAVNVLVRPDCGNTGSDTVTIDYLTLADI